MSIKSPSAWAAYKQARLRILTDFLETVEVGPDETQEVAKAQAIYDDACIDAWRVYLEAVARGMP